MNDALTTPRRGLLLRLGTPAGDCYFCGLIMIGPSGVAVIPSGDTLRVQLVPHDSSAIDASAMMMYFMIMV